jgi:hypothetical protein
MIRERHPQIPPKPDESVLKSTKIPSVQEYERSVACSIEFTGLTTWIESKTNPYSRATEYSQVNLFIID